MHSATEPHDCPGPGRLPEGAAYCLYVFWDGTHALMGADEMTSEAIADDLITFAGKMRQPDRLDGMQRFSELREAEGDD